MPVAFGLALLSGCDGSDSARLTADENSLARIEKQLAARAEGKQPARSTTEAQLERTSARPDGKAVVRVEKPVHDFGTRWGGLTLQHSFAVTNAGNTTLKIVKVRPNRGCALAEAYPKELAPGQSGTFSFTLDTKLLRGSYVKTIQILSNDPDQGELTLTLRGMAREYVDVFPVAALFGIIAGDETKSKVLKITNNTREPLEVTLGTVKPEGKFRFELEEKRPGQEFELRVTTIPPLPRGTPLNATVTLHTNVEARKTVEVRALGRVAERLDVYPKIVTMVKREGTETLHGTVRFTNYGDIPVELLDATVDDLNIAVKITRPTTGKAYTITLQAPASAGIPVTGRTLTLVSDDSEKPLIDVPVRIHRSAGTSSTAGRTAQKTPGKPRRRPALDMMGKEAPAFSLATRDGDPISNVEFSRSRATVLNFFAPDCGFCKRQIPQLEFVRSEFEAEGVRFVNISETMRKVYTNDEVVAVMKSLGVQLELAHDPGNKVGRLFKVVSYPTMFVVGPEGKIEHVNIGAKPNLDETLKTQLEGILRGSS